MSMVW